MFLYEVCDKNSYIKPSNAATHLWWKSNAAEIPWFRNKEKAVRLVVYDTLETTQTRT